MVAARGLPAELSRGVHVRYRWYGDKETKTPPHAKQGINLKFNTQLCRQELTERINPDFCAFCVNDGVEFDVYGEAPAGHTRRRPRSVHSVESADRLQLLASKEGGGAGEQATTKKGKLSGSAAKYEVDYFGNKKGGAEKPGSRAKKAKKPTSMAALADQNEELKREIERLKSAKKSKFCVLL